MTRAKEAELEALLAECSPLGEYCDECRTELLGVTTDDGYMITLCKRCRVFDEQKGV